MRIAVVAATLLLTTSIAAAQAPGQVAAWDPDAPKTPVQPAQPMTVSYRGQIIAADVASLGLTVLGPLIAPSAPSLSGIGFTGYFVAAPLVHLANGRGGAAAKSLGLRVALPFVGAMAGYHFGPDDMTCLSSADEHGNGAFGDCGDHGSLVGLLVGAAAGGITAMYIDVKYLSRYETTRPATWSAGFQPTRGGMALSFNGAF